MHTKFICMSEINVTCWTLVCSILMILRSVQVQKLKTYMVMLIERYTSTGYSDRTDNTTDRGSAWWCRLSHVSGLQLSELRTVHTVDLRAHSLCCYLCSGVGHAGYRINTRRSIQRTQISILVKRISILNRCYKSFISAKRVICPDFLTVFFLLVYGF